MMTGALVERRSPGRRVTHESMCWVGAAQESLLVQKPHVALCHRQPFLLAILRHHARALDLDDAAGGTCSPDTIQPGSGRYARANQSCPRLRPICSVRSMRVMRLFGCSVSALQTQRNRSKRTSGDLRQDVTERLMFTMVNFRRKG